MVRALRAATVPLVLVGLVGLAGWTLGRIFAGPLLAQLVLGAAIGSVAVSVASRRLPSWLVAPLSVVALAGYTGLALQLAATRAETVGPLSEVAADALRNGIPRLLTAMIPVEPTPDTVVVPVVVAWLAGLAGTEVAIRAGRVLLGLVPAAILYAAAGYVVGPNAPALVWPAVGFAALSTAALAATARPAASTPADLTAGLSAGTRAAVRVRAALGLVAALLAVVALPVLVGPWVAGRVDAIPVDPRRYVQPPQVDSLDESPLIRISGWALNPDQHLFDLSSRVTGSSPATGTMTPAGNADGGPEASTRSTGRTTGPVRLAVLPDYDGVTWRVGATYRSAGRVLPEQPHFAGARVDTVEQSITVAQLTGRLLPAVPTPRAVQGTRVAYDPGGGTLLRPEGLTEGLRYSVTSVLQRPDVNLLPTADVPAGAQVARFLEVGAGTPQQLQRLADDLARDNGAPYERAAAVEHFLGEHYRLVADAPSGHAYPNLAFFLFGSREAGGQRGTSEQFAASFAVLGRLMGLPTRVVVGFRPPANGGPVRGAHAYAWPEVLFDGLGWVSFDPLPRPDTAARPVEQDFNPRPERQPPPSPPPTAPPVSATATTGPAPLTAPPPAGGAGAAVRAGAGMSGVLAVLAAAGAVVLLRRRNQRRRRLFEGDPAQRIAGAWLEVTDALRLAGRAAPAHLAATEIARHAATAADPPEPGPAHPPAPGTAHPPAPRAAGPPAPGAAGPPGRGARAGRPVPPIDELAALVNATAFGPDLRDDEQARRAADQAVAYADGLRARQRWWRRVWWSVHPGPLRWHRRR